MRQFHGRYGLFVAVIVFLILLSACAAPATPEPVPTQEPQGEQNIPAESSIANLTANDVAVTVSNAQGGDTALQKFDTVNLPIGGRAALDTSGRGVLRFGDRHEVDLFGDTEIQLDDAKVESGGSTFLRFKQVAGHTFTRLNDLAVARVTLETEDSSLTTLEQGTEFAVCFAPGNLTCIVVNEGSLEVISQGQKEIYRKGEFTYYEPGQPPQPALCVLEDEFDDWVNRKRSQEATEALGQLVTGWPQEPCAPGAVDTPAVNTPAVDTPVVDYTPTAPAATTLPTVPPPPTVTTAPTVPPLPTVPPPLSVLIHSITIDSNHHYVVEYETFGYTEQLPGMHVHFFFDTVPPEQAGVPGHGPWILYGGPRPFTEYTVNDRPAQAHQMCALVANADHSIQLDTGNCVALP